MSTDPAMSTFLGDEVHHQEEEENGSSDSYFPYKQYSESKSVKKQHSQNSQEDTKTNNKMENGNRGHSNEEGDQHAVGNMVTCLIDKPHKQNVSFLTPNNSNLNFLGGSKQLYQNIT